MAKHLRLPLPDHFALSCLLPSVLQAPHPDPASTTTGFILIASTQHIALCLTRSLIPLASILDRVQFISAIALLAILYACEAKAPI
jgi:hypothetical protein